MTSVHGSTRRGVATRASAAVTLVAALAIMTSSLAAARVEPGAQASTHGPAWAVSAKPHGRPVVKPPIAEPGQLTTVTGKLPTRIRRSVVLRINNGMGWVKVASSKTTGRGAYRFITTAPGTAGPVSWRVQAPRTRLRTRGLVKTYKAYTSAPATTKVNAPIVTPTPSPTATPSPTPGPTPTPNPTPTPSPTPDPIPAPPPGEEVSVDVTPLEDVQLRATADLRILVPAGAGGSGPATLTYSPDLGKTGALQNGVELRSFADVHLSSGQPRTPLIFTWTFDEPLPPGWDGSFFTGDLEEDGLRPIPTTISADRRTAVASVSSLSPKSFGAWLEEDVSQFVGHVLSKRGDRPTCAGDVPAWVMSSHFVDQAGGDNPVLACVGSDPAEPDVLVVKMTNNRGHGLVLDVPADWSWMYLSNSAGIGDLSQELYAYLRTQGRRQVLLAPGQQLHLGFTREQVDQGGDPFVIDGSVSLEAVVFGLGVTAAEEVLGDKAQGSGVLAALMIAKCLPNAWNDDVSTVGDLTASLSANLSCFANVNAWVRLGIDMFGEDRFFDAIPIADAIKQRELVKKIGNRLMVLTIAQNLLDLAQSLTLQALAPTTFDLQVIARLRDDPEDPQQPTMAVRTATVCTHPTVDVDNSAGAVDVVVTLRGTASFGGSSGPYEARIAAGETGSVSTDPLPSGVAISWIDLDYSLRASTGELISSAHERFLCD